MNYGIKDIKLAEKGKDRIEWSENQMPVLLAIRKKFTEKRPLKEIKIAACLHVTTETANLVRTLKAGGAEVSLCASNPLSTQDDVAASLVKDYGIPVFAIKGEDKDVYYQHINQVLNYRPNITMDDGADLVSTVHSQKKELIKEIIAGTEETTTGVIRLRSMEKNKALKYPIIAVNDAQTKYLFDNRYGTGQSTLDGLLRATNILVAGKKFVICGYGWCARGLAMRANGMGAQVIITEIDPIKALEAVMDGYQVMPIKEAAKIGDIFITLTGDINVISEEEFPLMKDGVILANSGHFNVEINIRALENLAVSKKKIREYIEEYILKSSKKINLLAEGRLLNLSAAEGHPASVMDMSFANQALSVEYLVKEGKTLSKKVYSVPGDIDKEIARLKLESMGIKIDKLTEEQERYLSSWKVGT
ncbi:MAG: adenosylhomocysteinase [bacterium]|uniref:Adenosylhomocysteinase n=1 Tax=Candidatus Infernicultor aquiphilus TaxID=1805029 RepID=A0A1J5G8B1_9BACT|nr:adenosylhomocysteinase [bacterium]OIP68475.1 MAG: adenosylhomocysteinase [Candidatus Atribacteria bacterium CG2_30_33_13]PIU25042.1 MAG: adenosylhomocysteinase [Candidatus Atribacteria bacterium CG08_land_8_20_14_0_20_33_29]PIX33897.1 MAG: adenosylhomocysteinase [Candidatus Atribacteria bacterium CG_4_8_14_3_um_filter_34_18]PJB57175.1 MAG: adenosylhomocysteinase [Candidatus Atribacteria bacterium CG_4_9_14_3_um_filter_33_16]